VGRPILRFHQTDPLDSKISSATLVASSDQGPFELSVRLSG
jgi:hypothetical protein